MKRFPFRFLLWILLAAVAAPSFAQDKMVLNTTAYILDHPNLTRKVSLALNDTNIVDALVYLAEKAEINVAVSKAVEGRATLSLNNVAIRDALDIILISNELALEKRGDIFYVMPAADYEEQHGESWSEMRQVRIFKLQYAKPEEVVEILSGVVSKIGSAVADNVTGTLVVMDTPEKLKQIAETVLSLDHEQDSQVFDLKYANAKDVESYLVSKLNDRGVGTVRADEKYNRVIVTALPGKMDEIKKLIGQLDSKIKQVLIEAKMVRVTLSPGFEYGIDWERAFSYAARGNNAGGSNDKKIFDFKTSFAAGVAGAASQLILGRVAPNNSPEFVMRVLQEVGETKILSSPRITALNNEEATIFIGTRDFYTTSTTTQGTDTASTAIQINFIDVGIKLKVTPTINDNGEILMKIAPEVSRIDRREEIASGDEIPVVDTTTATTRVMVQDGNTIIIGGLISDETMRDTQKLPLLSDIPYIGNAFKHVRETKTKAELVVFLTPHIIGGDQDMTQFDTKKMKSLKGYDQTP